MYFETFGSETHINPYYSLASNDFIGIHHFTHEGIPVDNEQVKRFTKFMSSLHLDKISLQSYLDEGGDLLDSYSYLQRGNGEFNIITIPETIISCGSVKLMREFIYIEPEYINEIIGGHSILSHSIRYGCYDITDLLLVHGADPNTPGKRCKTSLYHAINQENLDIVKKLLDNGADPNMQYASHGLNYLYTALSRYVYYDYSDCDDDILNRKNIVKMLIKHGCECQPILYNSDILKAYVKIIAEMKENGEY